MVSVPIVPISEFKANPARYMSTGAVVTNHGRPRARLVPLDDPERDGSRTRTAAESAKTALRVLYRLQAEAEVAEELAELAAERDADVIGDPR